jgi:hypothetical protein
MLGINGYSPMVFEDIDAFRATHGGDLKSLVGQQIQTTWAMWSRVDDEWFSDGPVILMVNNRQLELAAFQFGFAITTDAIDRSKPIRWYLGEEEADDGLGLYWRENAPHLLELSAGKTITAIELFESRVTVGDAGWWNFDGVGFRLEQGYLAVYNNLDELGLADKPQEDQNIRATPL